MTALSTAEDAIDLLTERVPELQALRDESLEDNFGELLTYVVFGSYFMPWIRDQSIKAPSQR